MLREPRSRRSLRDRDRRIPFGKPRHRAKGIALAARAPPLAVGVPALVAHPVNFALPFLLIPHYVPHPIIRPLRTLIPVATATHRLAGKPPRGATVNTPTATGGGFGRFVMGGASGWFGAAEEESRVEVAGESRN